MARRKLASASRRGPRRKGRQGEWEVLIYPPVFLASTIPINAAPLSQVLVSLPLLSLIPAAGSLGNIGAVEVSPYEVTFDLLSVSVAGNYNVGLGIHKALWDPVAGFVPTKLDPLLPADACRDKTWEKGPFIQSMAIPAPTSYTAPTVLSHKWNVPKTVFEGHGDILDFVIANAAVTPVAIVVQYSYSVRYKQRRVY